MTMHIDESRLEREFPGTIASLGSSIKRCDQAEAALWHNRVEILHDPQPVAFAGSADVGLRRCTRCSWEFRT